METGMTLSPVIERRRSPRHHDIGGHGVVTARVRPGLDVSIVDVSSGGVSIECAHRLMPGAFVNLHLQREGGKADVVRGRVLRCSVVRLRPSAVLYQAAIAFERQLVWLGEESAIEYALPIANSPITQGSWAVATREFA